MSCTTADFQTLVGLLPEVVHTAKGHYDHFAVAGQTFAFAWERTQTVGLKQTRAEQLALVAERPEVFEIQYTSPKFGWVVVSLERIGWDELAELTYEAWRLTAPAALLAPGDEVLLSGLKIRPDR